MRRSSSILGCAVSVVLGAGAYAQPISISLAPSADVSRLRVDQVFTLDVMVSGLQVGTELMFLGATLTFDAATLGTPVIVARGPIVPASSGSDVFLTTVEAGLVDVSFRSFEVPPGQGIATDGRFFRATLRPTEAGVGAFALTFAGAFRPDPADPDRVIEVPVQVPEPLSYTVRYANDNCADATVVGDGLFSLANTFASTDGLPQGSCFPGADNTVSNDRWWRYVAPTIGTVKVSTCGATFDTRIVVYGPTCPAAAATPIACNDNNAACGSAASLFFAAEQGSQYLIRVGGRSGATGSGILAITGCPADIDDGTFTGRRDGGVTIDDLTYYLFLYLRGAIAADFDDGSGQGVRDAGVTIDDLLYFLAAYEQGC
jgi:hypothetical protein